MFPTCFLFLIFCSILSIIIFVKFSSLLLLLLSSILLFSSFLSFIPNSVVEVNLELIFVLLKELKLSLLFFSLKIKLSKVFLSISKFFLRKDKGEYISNCFFFKIILS